MLKISLSIIVIFGCYVLSDGLRCCTCSNDKTIDVSYRECKNNNTCKWTCSVTKKCGPLFWDPSAKEGPPNVTFDNIWVLNPRQDETITLPCKIRSNPEANVTWFFNGRDISSYSTSHVKNNKGDCSSVLGVKAHASGLFTCLVQNAYGSKNHTFKVDVEPHQKIPGPRVQDLKIDTEDNMAYLGSTFNLSCTVRFNPSTSSFPQIAFIRHGQRVWDIAGKYENFPAADIDGNWLTRKLSLKNVTIAEEGNWSCYGLENGLRGDSKTLNLKIVPCPAGYYCPWNDSSKRECPYGTYTDGMANFTYQCTECPGQYPSSKPKGYSGPAKSIKECPAKVSTKASYPTTTLIVGISISFIIVLIVVSFKFKKQLKQFLLKTISVDNLSSGPQLVINDFCAYESKQRLFTSAAAGPEEAPEFPILYDVFISHSSKDVTFATEIQTELERQDFKCCIHIRDFTPGETILDNISNAIYGSRVTLAILSPDFVESEWCNSELQQALTRSMRDHRVIPILYKNCQIPRELLHRTYIDYENCYVKPYFWEQLIKVLRPMRSPMAQSNV